MNERDITGILCLNKPAGMTSHDVVGRIRRLYGTKKVGHTGTLDPMATGVLVILLGKATRLSDFLLADKKLYYADLTLGITTDTQDITGKLLSSSKSLPSFQQVSAVCEQMIGKQMQCPPMYSAKKINGQKLYDLARQGKEVNRSSSEIEIYRLIPKVQDESAGLYSLEILCSKGTYIRTICHDIGQKLGCGGVMSSLCRMQNGQFALSTATSLEELEQMDQLKRDSLLFSPESALSYLPKIQLPDFFAGLASHGCEIYQKKIGTSFSEEQLILLYRKNSLFALGQVRLYPDGSAIKPIRFLE
jgi:tRNA pseudouridine55 synthase